MELFGTAGIRGAVGESITPQLALDVGAAVGLDGDEVVVGRDGRETGETLVAALTAGLTSAGADVRRVGQVPTPALAFASRGRRGVMVTASHNPPGDNGIKLFVDGREYERAAEERVAERVAEGVATEPWDEWGGTTAKTVLPDYRQAVCTYAGQYGTDAEHLKVAVDCGNGMASLATPQVLMDLGATVEALNANVDGHFPARESKPTAEAISDLRTYVASGDADLGIAHDGDADRIVLVGNDGEVVHEDTVLAIVAEHLVARSDIEDPVVLTTPNASARIDERVRATGGRVERVRLGALHEGMLDIRAESRPGTQVVFAAEPWKHVHPGLGRWIDGVASAALLVRLVAAEGLRGLREPVTERPYRKVSVDCPDDRKALAMETLEETLPERFPAATVSTEYGVRLELPEGGWTLVRPSGTEPYVRIYAESETVDGLVETVRETVESAVADAT